MYLSTKETFVPDFQFLKHRATKVVQKKGGAAYLDGHDLIDQITVLCNMTR